MRHVREYLVIVGLLLLAGTTFACGGPWRDGYFKKGVDRLTQDEVVEKFGRRHLFSAGIRSGRIAFRSAIRN
jgi:hypothetical protein